MNYKPLIALIGLLLLVYNVSATCNLDNCADYNTLKECGEIYKQHGITDELWLNCVHQCSQTRCNQWSLDNLFAFVNTALWDRFDVNDNCYFETGEVIAAVTAFKAGEISSTDFVNIDYYWTNSIKNENCPITDPTTPQCSPSCEAYTGDCDHQRNCVNAACNSYVEERSVNSCCFARCGDGLCMATCSETCATCATDCGSCSNPTCSGGQVEEKTCDAVNGCHGTKIRQCLFGEWGEWSFCTTDKNKCADTSCQVVCPTPTTTMQQITTTTIQGITTTTQGNGGNNGFVLADWMIGIGLALIVYFVIIKK